jgi:hypothetical protein
MDSFHIFTILLLKIGSKDLFIALIVSGNVRFARSAGTMYVPPGHRNGTIVLLAMVTQVLHPDLRRDLGALITPLVDFTRVFETRSMENLPIKGSKVGDADTDQRHCKFNTGPDDEVNRTFW